MPSCQPDRGWVAHAPKSVSAKAWYRAFMPLKIVLQKLMREWMTVTASRACCSCWAASRMRDRSKDRTKRSRQEVKANTLLAWAAGGGAMGRG